VQDRENQANLTVTVIHEFDHALLHFDDDETEHAKRQVEAEAWRLSWDGTVVSTTTGSAFYLAAWNSMTSR
jgi:hypothetical protein